MKKLNLLIALFFIATLSFNVYLNLNNPFQFSSKQVIAQTTGGGNSNSETGGWNYWAHYILDSPTDQIQVRDYYFRIETGGFFKYYKLPIGFNGSFQKGYGLVAIIIGCPEWKFGTCDKSRIGEIVATYVRNYH